MIIELFSHTQQVMLHALTWQLVAALEMSHHQATNKTTKWKALYVIERRSPPFTSMDTL
jgi:hypothetical protein